MDLFFSAVGGHGDKGRWYQTLAGDSLALACPQQGQGDTSVASGSVGMWSEWSVGWSEWFPSHTWVVLTVTVPSLCTSKSPCLTLHLSLHLALSLVTSTAGIVLAVPNTWH